MGERGIHCPRLAVMTGDNKDDGVCSHCVKTRNLPLATGAPSKAEADIFFMTLQGGNIKPETVREQLRSCPVLSYPVLFYPLVPRSRRKLKCK